MPTKRLPMRQLRDILRLKFEYGLSHRAIARTCSVGLGTVSEYLGRADRAGICWPLPEELDDTALEAKLFPSSPQCDLSRPRPDVAHIHQELKRPGVTLQLLWEEYVDVHPKGYRYSQFCEHYRQFAKKLKPSMRQVHRAGEKAFVDFSGKKPSIVDPKTGEVREVELFVGVLGASSYVYAEAVESQELPNWIAAHVRMFEAWDGSTAILVPDNLKSAVTNPCLYEPGVNRSYRELCGHYGAVAIPARTYHPKDKPKAEVSVLLVQRWIIAALRNRTFFSLSALNEAIREKLKILNDRPMQQLGVSRRELYERLDRPALTPLPRRRYELGEWKVDCAVNIDYHVAFEHNFYSVPYQLIHERVDVRATHSTVELLFKSKRVASHQRLRGRGQYATDAQHMPRAHQAHAEWTPSRLISWAGKTGPAAAYLVKRIMEDRPHPEQGYRACLGIMRLGRMHGLDRLEVACLRAAHLKSFSYKTVQNILASGMDRVPLDEKTTEQRLTPRHNNIRGADYYSQSEN
jgi:transposase